jgi:hypothetical protein
VSYLGAIVVGIFSIIYFHDSYLKEQEERKKGFISLIEGSKDEWLAQMNGSIGHWLGCRNLYLT